MDQQVVTPTEQAHQELQRAFDAINAQLFQGELPSCLITLQRGRNFRGYFSAHRFIRSDAATTHEIAINPQIFALATLPEVLSELVHNMVHLWAHVRGKAGRRGYHSKEWAAKMVSIGLMPTTTGLPGGKVTGEKVEHYIVEGGPFDELAKSMLLEGFNITWLDRMAAPWREGPAGGEGRGHLLGEALLGKTGLLVDGSDGDHHEVDDRSLPPSGGTKSTFSHPDPRATTGEHDMSFEVSNSDALSGDREEERDPWERHSVPSSTMVASATAGQSTDAMSGEMHASSVILASGLKSKGDETTRTVPLLVRPGDDITGKQGKKRQDKVRFDCPKCSQKAWAKGKAKLDCGVCKVTMVPLQPLEPA